nr:immunoglobulin light chain junction region [Macaca mulatta]MOV95019.1 immunoglobulin light chain junction region [Macaca mulatta]MOV96187.1 immunoglobulin light chain junction region [Macaca mulatta]MOV96426.1 immunoglobulin light chain junction region [Macaca mulatta]MOV96480.1 immunoglobulin light chain junction region [Macaca mulatta]
DYYCCSYTGSYTLIF